MTYDYKCCKCKTVKEVTFKNIAEKEKSVVVCECGYIMKQTFNNGHGGFVLLGGGWPGKSIKK
jgi:predicted nucleic acid-binding Zn ribbon protein